MGYIKVIILSAVVALAIIFMIQNITPLSHPLGIRLNLFFVKWESTPYPTYLVILLAFFVGLLATSLVGISERWRLRRQVKAQVKKTEELRRELNSLRNLPVTGEPMVAGGMAQGEDFSANEAEAESELPALDQTENDTASADKEKR
ncbi:MAG: LapA family protein [Desulfarculaceae bacterium]|nr:LapA family protein [Desulfarculaceae bacterium]MCF8071842.1 LapA family protein [Desulfarculaceae bacterium]MCF8101392.1 LapA family protein [Desulfarculaceae bacterium]MCF8117383.1 LapA family protein [Desulfarculaceae bacterium]